MILFAALTGRGRAHEDAEKQARAFLAANLAK
jgi:hypothetical protein